MSHFISDGLAEAILAGAVQQGGLQQRDVALSLLALPWKVEWSSASSFDINQYIVYIKGGSANPYGDFMHEIGHMIFREYRLNELNEDHLLGVNRDPSKTIGIMEEREANAILFEWWQRSSGPYSLGLTPQKLLEFQNQVMSAGPMQPDIYLKKMRDLILPAMRNSSVYQRWKNIQIDQIRQGKKISAITDSPVTTLADVSTVVDGELITSALISELPFGSLPSRVSFVDSMDYTPRHVTVYRNGVLLLDTVVNASIEDIASRGADIGKAASYGADYGWEWANGDIFDDGYDPGGGGGGDEEGWAFAQSFDSTTLLPGSAQLTNLFDSAALVPIGSEALVASQMLVESMGTFKFSELGGVDTVNPVPRSEVVPLLAVT
ncbi:hypothetical protein ACG02S_25985 [Roseateles sp. DC23W]|uniref:Uncharacterized protein n=1 Tax=Pelomonas dachongensis TaxID=3299029 RepID=A0ABW7EYV4_9BURK